MLFCNIKLGVVLLAARLLCIQVVAHGIEHEEHALHKTHPVGTMHQDAETIHSNASITPANTTEQRTFPSYYAYSEFRGIMSMHIALMILAWICILPIGLMLTINRSRLAVPSQLVFLIVHGLAVLLGRTYRSSTPDLYENNLHIKIGWVMTWAVTAQCIVAMVRSLGGNNSRDHEYPHQFDHERENFLPVTTEALRSHQNNQRHTMSDGLVSAPDSDIASASAYNRSSSAASMLVRTPNQRERERRQRFQIDRDYDLDGAGSEKVTLAAARMTKNLIRFLISRLPHRALQIVFICEHVMNRCILLFGFAAIVSGLAVYAGIWRGNGVFNGLAHAIKGGIFFWYGLLTLGRWMGCFLEIGWAWNAKPPARHARKSRLQTPSAEFVESFLIFLYGASNVFLEHLAAWGDAWTAQDLEHLAITIMFFGGGLCGMLIESSTIKKLLNSSPSTVNTSLFGKSYPQRLQTFESSSTTIDDGSLEQSSTDKSSMNPMPALIIFLLGLMMSSHHQHSMTSTMIHKQWGTLFVGAAFARGLTYILVYLAPPSSYVPSRPPSELICAFCLISGGLIFMVSNRDTVNAIESYHLPAMLIFTVMMGIAALIMAWTIVVLAVKGWVVRRKLLSQTSGISERY